MADYFAVKKNEVELEKLFSEIGQLKIFGEQRPGWKVQE